MVDAIVSSKIRACIVGPNSKFLVMRPFPCQPYTLPKIPIATQKKKKKMISPYCVNFLEVFFFFVSLDRRFARSCCWVTVRLSRGSTIGSRWRSRTCGRTNAKCKGRPTPKWTRARRTQQRRRLQTTENRRRTDRSRRNHCPRWPTCSRRPARTTTTTALRGFLGEKHVFPGFTAKFFITFILLSSFNSKKLLSSSFPSRATFTFSYELQRYV